MRPPVIFKAQGKAAFAITHDFCGTDIGNDDRGGVAIDGINLTFEVFRGDLAKLYGRLILGKNPGAENQ